MKKVRIETFSKLDPAKPARALVANVDLVIVRWPDEDEVRDWERCHPQPFDRSAYQGAYADPLSGLGLQFTRTWLGLNRSTQHSR
jgi:hypothetical protein